MKKTLLLLATLTCAAALYLGYHYSKTLTPETVLQQLFDMNAPARYAFVSDTDAPKLAVIDLESNRQTSLLELAQPARNLTIHKTLGLLAYNDGGTTVTIRQLGDHSEKNHQLPHPVTRLQFDADSPAITKEAFEALAREHGQIENLIKRLHRYDSRVLHALIEAPELTRDTFSDPAALQDWIAAYQRQLDRFAAAGITLRLPPLRFCTDNGAQIAALGSAAARAGVAPSPMDFAPDSGMPLDVSVAH